MHRKGSMKSRKSGSINRRVTEKSLISDEKRSIGFGGEKNSITHIQCNSSGLELDEFNLKPDINSGCGTIEIKALQTVDPSISNIMKGDGIDNNKHILVTDPNENPKNIDTGPSVFNVSQSVINDFKNVRMKTPQMNHIKTKRI